jgi:hypothetical protein
MSIQEFNSVLQSHVYKKLLKKLDDNVITNSTTSLRSSQQTATKTDFAITRSTVQEMYHTITGKELNSSEAESILEIIAKPSSNSKAEGMFIKVAGQNAVKFESIAFAAITTKINNAFSKYPEVKQSYKAAEKDYYDKKVAEILNTIKKENFDSEQEYFLTVQLEKELINDEAKRRATLGYYFNKGHVIGIATNLTKEFRDNIAKSNKLAKNERDLLVSVLDQYIVKLEKDDLSSANLPNAIDQSLYANYIKSSSKYLVEMQLAITNQGAGSQEASPALKELRKLFTPTEKDLTDILNKSPVLGRALLNSEGSPSFIDLLSKDLASIIRTGKKSPKQLYVSPSVLVGKKTTKIIKPKSNKQEISKLKAIKSKLQSVNPDSSKIKEVAPIIPQAKPSLTSLQSLINTHLQNVISANMGDGSSKKVLNYRTGRFASSAKVESMSQSRQGMITAFYSYMKNPYQTFEPGFRQGSPKTRDPKLLISQSIREIAATRVGNQLRAQAL